MLNKSNSINPWNDDSLILYEAQNMYANEIKKCQYNKAKLINFTLIKNQSHFKVVCACAL